MRLNPNEVYMCKGQHVRKIHYKPNLKGWGAHAWMRAPFHKEHQWADDVKVVGHLVTRMKAKGWRIV